MEYAVIRCQPTNEVGAKWKNVEQGKNNFQSSQNPSGAGLPDILK